MNDSGQLKPGFTTSEFAGMIVSQLFAVFVMLKWIPPGDAHSLEDALKQIIIGAITIGGNVGIVVKYVHDRGGLKKMILEKTTNSGDNSSSVPIPPLPKVGG